MLPRAQKDIFSQASSMDMEKRIWIMQEILKNYKHSFGAQDTAAKQLYDQLKIVTKAHTDNNSCFYKTASYNRYYVESTLAPQIEQAWKSVGDYLQDENNKKLPLYPIVNKILNNYCNEAQSLNHLWKRQILPMVVLGSVTGGLFALGVFIRNAKDYITRRNNKVMSVFEFDQLEKDLKVIEDKNLTATLVDKIRKEYKSLGITFFQSQSSSDLYKKLCQINSENQAEALPLIQKYISSKQYYDEANDVGGGYYAKESFRNNGKKLMAAIASAIKSTINENDQANTSTLEARQI